MHKTPLAIVAMTLALSQTAHSSGEEVLGHLSSMCPYKYAKTGAKTPYVPPAGDKCKLISLEGLFRHGTRQPTAKYIGRIGKTLGGLIDKYGDEIKLQWMKEWKTPYVYSVGGLLTPMGVSEAYEVGSRITKYFKSTLLPYNPNEVLFKPTGVSRASQTAAEFGRAMLNGDYSVPLALLSDSMDHDNVLYFQSNCERYIKEVKRNSTATYEPELFLSLHLSEIASRISEKTGIPTDALTTDVISIMWGACQSDVDVFDDTSMWCSLFSAKDASLMEYYDDLGAYYTKGYAYPINHKMASLLFQDVVKGLEESRDCVGSATDADLCVRSRLRFAHAETLIPFLVGLGLYKDEKPLTATWSESEREGRKWRFENMAPMLGSAVLLQYRCDENDDDDETFVELYHNEMVVEIPGCNSTDSKYGNVDPRLCPLSKFKELLKDYLTCDWNQLCDL